jgi:hypothetical protein
MGQVSSIHNQYSPEKAAAWGEEYPNRAAKGVPSGIRRIPVQSLNEPGMI